jgi:cytochrome b561
MNPILLLTIAILLITYLNSDRVRGWWHSPSTEWKNSTFFFARTRLHTMLAWLILGLILAGFLLWAGRPPRHWDFFVFQWLINGLLTLKILDWAQSTREWMKEQQTNGRKPPE